MSWWPWSVKIPDQKPAYTVSLNAPTGKKDDDPFPCPKCSARDKAYRMMEMSSFYPGLEERVTSYGVECQGCGNVYCISDTGTWTPSPNSKMGRYMQQQQPTTRQEKPKSELKASVGLDPTLPPEPIDRPNI